MAKLSSVNKNNRRIKLSNKFYKKREKLKKEKYVIKILVDVKILKLKKPRKRPNLLLKNLNLLKK